MCHIGLCPAALYSLFRKRCFDLASTILDLKSLTADERIPGQLSNCAPAPVTESSVYNQSYFRCHSVSFQLPQWHLRDRYDFFSFQFHGVLALFSVVSCSKSIHVVNPRTTRSRCIQFPRGSSEQERLAQHDCFVV